MTGQQSESQDPPPTFTQTYSWADGELVGCDYQWMTSDDAFVDEMRDGYVDEPRDMLIETWERTAVEVRRLWPSLGTCSYEDENACEEDAVVWQSEDEGTVWMQACEKHRHPLVAGQSGSTNAESVS